MNQNSVSAENGGMTVGDLLGFDRQVELIGQQEMYEEYRQKGAEARKALPEAMDNLADARRTLQQSNVYKTLKETERKLESKRDQLRKNGKKNPDRHNDVKALKSKLRQLKETPWYVTQTALIAELSQEVSSIRSTIDEADKLRIDERSLRSEKRCGVSGNPKALEQKEKELQDLWAQVRVLKRKLKDIEEENADFGIPNKNSQSWRGIKSQLRDIGEKIEAKKGEKVAPYHPPKVDLPKVSIQPVSMAASEPTRDDIKSEIRSVCLQIKAVKEMEGSRSPRLPTLRQKHQLLLAQLKEVRSS